MKLLLNKRTKLVTRRDAAKLVKYTATTRISDRSHKLLKNCTTDEEGAGTIESDNLLILGGQDEAQPSEPAYRDEIESLKPFFAWQVADGTR